MNPHVMNRPMAYLMPLLVLVLNSTVIHSQHFTFTEVPDVWYNTQLTPEILESHRYASVDVHLLNPATLSKLKFFPPKPKNHKAKREWDKQFYRAKDMKYLCANVVFPAAKNPWNSDLKIPLYLLDLEDNGRFYGNVTSVNIMNRIPRQNEHFNHLEASLKLDNIEKKKLNEFAGNVQTEISSVATFVKENPKLGSIEFAKTLEVKGKEFTYHTSMKDRYEISFDFQLYSLGNYDEGIIQQIDVYTIVPSDLGNKNYPKLEKTITSFRSVEEVIQKLTTEEQKFPQFLVVYRIHQHDYKHFNTEISEELIEQQTTEIADLKEFGFISDKEAALWNDLLTLKRMILSMNVQAITPYYTHLDKQEPYAKDFLNIIEDYRAINLKLIEFEHKYQHSKLYKEHFKPHFAAMQHKADADLLNPQNNPSLEGAYYFVQALLERKTRKPIDNLAGKYTVAQKLNFLQKEGLRMKAQGEAGYMILENSPYYELANINVLVLEKEIYIEKYQDKVEKLNKQGEHGSSFKELTSILESNAESCNYCKSKIRSALEKYRDNKALAALEKLQKKYQNIKRNLPKEALDFKNEVYRIERILDSPEFLAGNGDIIKDYKTHLFSLREHIVKLERFSLKDVNITNEKALKQFYQDYNDIIKPINNLRFIFEDNQKDFGSCFSSEGEIKP